MSTNTDGFVYRKGRDIWVNIANTILVWQGVIPAGVSNANIRVKRSGEQCELYIDGANKGVARNFETGEFTNFVGDGKWLLRYIGNDIAFPSDKIKDVMYGLSLKGYVPAQGQTVFWRMGDETDKFRAELIGKVNPSSYSVGLTVKNNTVTHSNKEVTYLTSPTPPVTYYTANIINYEPAHWLKASFGYVVKFYKALTPTEKVLVREVGLLPKTVGVPVSYQDTNGVF